MLGDISYGKAVEMSGLETRVRIELPRKCPLNQTLGDELTYRRSGGKVGGGLSTGSGRNTQ